MFRKILFATTSSPGCDNAARVAFCLARKYKSSLDILHVFGVPSHGNSLYVIDVKTGEEENIYNSEYTAWVREEIRNLYSEELARTPGSTIECCVGVPYREILRRAREGKVDAIIMGSHTCMPDSESDRFRNAVGNTMQHVAKHASCPVFIISRPCRPTIWESTRIVYATDFSKACSSAFSFAGSMARQINSRLLIFHSIDITPRQFGQMESQRSIENRIEIARKRIETEYIPRLEGYDHYEIHVWEGIPYVEILKFAREKDANLIVMAHHNPDNPGGDNRIGSMVEQVVLRSICPVVSVSRPVSENRPGLWEMEDVMDQVNG